jgi:hypothetical protein
MYMDRMDLPASCREYISEILYDRLGGCEPEISWKAAGTDMFRVTLGFDLREPVRQDDWQLKLKPGFIPGFHWAPHLAPAGDNIMDQHSFRSPSLIASNADKLLILIPDLAIMEQSTPVRWYLDLDAQNNSLTLGMSEYRVTDHVLYVREKGACYPKGKVEIGFYLLITDDREKIFNPWRNVLGFLWDGWGRKRYEAGEPLQGRLDSYLEHTYQWALESWKEHVWQEFEVEGRKVGASVFIVNVTQSPNYKGEVNEREFRSIWNQAWFSSLRSAQGMYRYGRYKKDEELIRKALLTKELALSAPQKQGFFPAVIAAEMVQVEIDGKSYSRSRGWETCYWGNSNRNPFTGDAKRAPYHVLDMSWTAWLLLTWYEELEQDERLKDYAIRYADALLKLQDQRGFFPAWLDQNSLEPMGVLDDSPETSMSVTFLLKAYEITGCNEYRLAALKAMDAVCREIIPEGRWEDFETYWSCCRYGSDSLVGKKIARNNMYKQCNFSMYWTAAALLNCYRMTSSQEYLRLGRRCLDEMLMTQASWQPPYMFVNTLGGFGVMNCDGEWNDARQSLFAEVIVQYGLELDENEYIQRGLAAMRCSFVMMYCPENTRTKAQWEEKWPFFNDKDYGFMMENYGHGGEVGEKGLGIGEFTIFDWGNGAAAECYMRMQDHYGFDFVSSLLKKQVMNRGK